MSLQKIDVTYYRLFEVRFPTDEVNSEVVARFSTLSEANKLAKLKRGWYGSSGNTYEKDYKETESLPKYYETFDDWAKANLTFNEYQKVISNK